MSDQVPLNNGGKFKQKEYPDHKPVRPVLFYISNTKIKFIDIVDKLITPKSREKLKNVLCKFGVRFATKN